MKLTKIEGEIADSTQLESIGYARAKITKGNHKRHTLILSTSKFNCGGFWEDLDCSCEAHWHNYSNGCWQCGHAREEHGDNTLKEALKEFYRALE